MLLREHKLHQDRLAQALGAATSAKDQVGILHDYLSELADPQGSAVKAFPTPQQAEVALSILGIYKDHFRRLLEIFERLPQPAPPPAAPPQETQPDNGPLLGVGAAALIGGVIANPLLGVPLALAGGLLASKWARSAEESAAAAPPPAAPPVPPGFSAFLSELEELLKTIDNLVEGIGQLQAPAQRQEDAAPLLALVQEVLGWHCRHKDLLPETSTQALEQRLADLFPGQALEIRYFNAAQGEPDPALFELAGDSGDPDADALETTRPALLANGEVLLRGQVARPLPPAHSASPVADNYRLKPTGRNRKNK